MFGARGRREGGAGYEIKKGLTILHQEHLDSKDTGARETGDGILSNLPGTLLNRSREGLVRGARQATSDLGGGKDQMTDAVLVDRLNNRVRANLTRHGTDNHHRQLPIKLGPTLSIEWYTGGKLRASVLEIVLGLDDIVALAVVSHGLGLKHEGIAKLLSCLLDGLLIRTIQRVCEGDLVLCQVLLLEILVLDQGDGGRGGVDRLP